MLSLRLNNLRKYLGWNKTGTQVSNPAPKGKKLKISTLLACLLFEGCNFSAQARNEYPMKTSLFPSKEQSQVEKLLSELEDLRTIFPKKDRSHKIKDAVSSFLGDKQWDFEYLKNLARSYPELMMHINPDLQKVVNQDLIEDNPDLNLVAYITPSTDYNAAIHGNLYGLHNTNNDKTLHMFFTINTDEELEELVNYLMSTQQAKKKNITLKVNLHGSPSSLTFNDSHNDKSKFSLDDLSKFDGINIQSKHSKKGAKFYIFVEACNADNNGTPESSPSGITRYICEGEELLIPVTAVGLLERILAQKILSGELEEGEINAHAKTTGRDVFQYNQNIGRIVSNSTNILSPSINEKTGKPDRDPDGDIVYKVTDYSKYKLGQHTGKFATQRSLSKDMILDAINNRKIYSSIQFQKHIEDYYSTIEGYINKMIGSSSSAKTGKIQVSSKEVLKNFFNFSDSANGQTIGSSSEGLVDALKFLDHDPALLHKYLVKIINKAIQASEELQFIEDKGKEIFLVNFWRSLFCNISNYQIKLTDSSKDSLMQKFIKSLSEHRVNYSNMVEFRDDSLWDDSLKILLEQRDLFFPLNKAKNRKLVSQILDLFYIKLANSPEEQIQLPIELSSALYDQHILTEEQKLKLLSILTHQLESSYNPQLSLSESNPEHTLIANLFATASSLIDSISTFNKETLKNIKRINELLLNSAKQFELHLTNSSSVIAGLKSLNLSLSRIITKLQDQGVNLDNNIDSLIEINNAALLKLAKKGYSVNLYSSLLYSNIKLNDKQKNTIMTGIELALKNRSQLKAQLNFYHQLSTFKDPNQSTPKLKLNKHLKQIFESRFDNLAEELIKLWRKNPEPENYFIFAKLLTNPNISSKLKKQILEEVFSSADNFKTLLKDENLKRGLQSIGSAAYPSLLSAILEKYKLLLTTAKGPKDREHLSKFIKQGISLLGGSIDQVPELAKAHRVFFEILDITENKTFKKEVVKSFLGEFETYSLNLIKTASSIQDLESKLQIIYNDNLSLFFNSWKDQKNSKQDNALIMDKLITIIEKLDQEVINSAHYHKSKALTNYQNFAKSLPSSLHLSQRSISNLSTHLLLALKDKFEFLQKERSKSNFEACAQILETIFSLLSRSNNDEEAKLRVLLKAINTISKNYSDGNHSLEELKFKIKAKLSN